MVSMIEGTNTPVTEFGQYSIFVDYSSTNTNSTSSNNIEEVSTSTLVTATNQQTIKVVTRTVYVSTHSDTEDLSNYNEKTAFEITAGRERMATVGSDIEFNTKYNLLQKDQCLPSFKWSFGDGFTGSGKIVSHIYKYPGEYQVVLNGTCGEYNAISRTKVVIVSPSISISNLINGDIEVLNKGKLEMNIGLWKIRGGKDDFIFPQDTIIIAGGKITLSKEDLKIDDTVTKISLNNPSNREVDSTNIKVLSQNASSTTSQTVSVKDSYISVSEAERLVKEYKEKIALKSRQINKTIETDNIDTSKNNINEVATVSEAISSSSTKGFWSKLIDIPIKGIKSFVGIFYNFE